MHIVAAIVVFIIAAVLFYFARRSTSDANAYGLYVNATRPSELAEGVPGFYGGTVVVVSGQPALLTPYSKQPCVSYSYTIEELRDVTDNQGNRTSEWQQVTNSPPNSVLFALQNGGDYVLVNAAGASIHHESKQQQYIDQSQSAGIGGVLGELVNMVGNQQRRVNEFYIPLGAQFNVGGVVSEQSGVKTFIDNERYPLVLTTDSKESLVKSERSSSYWLYGLSAVFSAAAVAAFVFIKN